MRNAAQGADHARASSGHSTRSMRAVQQREPIEMISEDEDNRLYKVVVNHEE